MSYRVLLVDDSKVTLRALERMLRSDDSYTVVGIANSGELGWSMMQELRPDLVLLDLIMPDMDGLAFVRRTQGLAQAPKIILFTAFSEAQHQLLAEALLAGAADFLDKPTALKNRGPEKVLSELKEKVTQLFEQPLLHFSEENRLPKKQTADLILIAASTGGPEILAKIMGALPANYPLPVVILQHMPDYILPYLFNSLCRQSSLPIHLAHDNMTLFSGAYLLPIGNDFELQQSEQQWILKAIDPQSELLAPSADQLFSSAAQKNEGRIVAIILTGMGRDGAEGANALYQQGNEIIVQDRESSIVWGMPQSVLEQTPAIELSPDEIIAHLYALGAQKDAE
jgi:two-component system, chemotaxis family, protein-glutamate methylesterase/glutaminase